MLSEFREAFLLPAVGQRLYEKESPAQVFFCKLCKTFKNTPFTDYLRATASEFTSLQKEELITFDRINYFVFPKALENIHSNFLHIY